MINPFLVGDKIYLRAPMPGDEYMYALSENQPEIRAVLYVALPSSPQQQWQRIEQRMSDAHTVLFTIAVKETDKPVGTTSLVRIDWVAGMATFYIAIAEKENWSRGYGGEATKMMVDYAFNTLNLHRVQLHVSVKNERAIKTYRKLGFEIEGTLRQAMFFDGEYIDFYLMAVLKDAL